MPSITAWTKLEAQAHHEEIEDGLAARLYDPLWLLARQWQMREFAAEDAGWPVTARLRLKQLPLTRIHLGALPENGHAQGQPYRPDALPLEALVERERVHGPHAAPITRRLAAEAGLHFLALLAHHGAPELCDSFRAAFPLMPPDVEQEKLLDLRSRRFLSVMGRRAADGEALYIAFRAAGGPSALPPVSATQQPRLLAAMDAYVRWYEDLFCEPVSDDPLPSSRAWLPERMEYTFALSARDDDEEIVLQAPEYHGARLDWYSVDVAPTLTLGSDGDGPQSKTVTSLSVPAGVRYRGMPAARWWEFEDAEVNFAQIDAGPDELLRLTLVDFALTYGNDWFVIPVDLSPGALYRLQSLVVTDSFGERFLVPHYSELDDSASGFALFSLANGARNFFYMPSVPVGVHQAPPIEEVLLLRDEMANLAWAVEKKVSDPAGIPLDRYESYQQREGNRMAEDALLADRNDAIYRLSSVVPDYWTPLVPMRLTPGDAEIRLRRARLLLESDDVPVTAPVLGQILHSELPLELFEEEVPPEGARITRSFQHVRWIDGSTCLWLGRQKRPGQGQGFSGLRHDIIDEGTGHE